ncbi:uncharacterized protein N7469_009721 [Penicillium citrinum]|uniref:Uncharacterized protein n=1 Tax=Penicillium citrinum TaxID=5077 RepID=A0A9W9TFU6_PENCI|nr:uncharacterized protein N7469_009721 [Penicillium citrinum]KAJ5220834.1 hypothetical protein N7469_009721 [Penicillium citrinum]
MCGTIRNPKRGEGKEINIQSSMRLTGQVFDHPFVVSQVGENPESNLYMRGVMWLMEETDLRYANPSASKPKNTEVLEPTISEAIHYLGTSSPALRFEKIENDHSLDTDSSATKVTGNIVSPEPEDEDQQDASPIIREAGLVLKETQKSSLKRNLGSSKWEPPAGIRRSARVAKRLKI